jgi:two-component system chemotaxis sensor kinase CheA
MGDLDDLIKDFLVESYENLDQLDRDFVALETDPGAPDKMGSIFRTIHTIKGTCGCLGLPKLEATAHVGENLLSRLRDGQLVMDGPITTALLRLVDAIREMLSSIERTGNEGAGDYSAVRNELIRLNERPSVGGGSAPAAGPHHAPSPVMAPAPMSAEEVALEAARAQYLASEAAAAAAPAPVPDVTAHEPRPPDAHADAHQEPPDDHAPAAKSGESVANNAVRVDVGQLDKLMNLVGELVLTRNQVLQFLSNTKDAGLLRTAQRLNLITTELQEGVMKTRMQPIGNLWNKFPRIVRDVANTCGKRVRLDMDGKDTELDRTVLEAIKDPLTHIIRNSVDHGVESPGQRREQGKPDEGVLSMRAFHEGGQVIIEITDDGAGIDPDRIRRKAVEKGLITAEASARMGEREAINLVFAPGFSTAERVTNVSGRGVGMDVVKTNVEKIGGTVDVSSRVGAGTTLKIKIPLTLAIIPALIVTSGGDRYCIPQVSLLELVRVGPTAIERIAAAPVYRLRGNLLPLVYLSRELCLPAPDAARPVDDGPTNIVVLRNGERTFGLVVDAINDTEEIVVKPLSKSLKAVSVYAGATIMGDGKVALILDVMGLAVRAGLMALAGEATGRAAAERAPVDSDSQQLLLLRVAGGRRVAIPLAAVARLEVFARRDVELAGGTPAVQYRKRIMPLVDVAESLGAASTDDPGPTVQTVVHAAGDRNVGLLVEQILDVVEERVQIHPGPRRHGLLGTAIIKEKITDLLDVATLVGPHLAA